MSDFCENCNPHSSYHTTAVGEYLVDIWFAEICQMTLYVFGSQSMLSKSTRLLYGSTASCRSIYNVVCMPRARRRSWVWFQRWQVPWFFLSGYLLCGSRLLLSKFNYNTLGWKTVPFIFIYKLYEHLEKLFFLQFDTKFASKQQRLAKIGTILWLLLSTQISQVWHTTRWDENAECVMHGLERPLRVSATQCLQCVWPYKAVLTILSITCRPIEDKW